MSPDFLLIPFSMILDNAIKYREIKVYGIILWIWRTTKLKKCFVSNNTIVKILDEKESTKMSVSSVQNSLKMLESKKYIKRIYKKKDRKIRTEIIPLVYGKVPPTGDTHSTKYHPQVIGVPPTGDTRVSPTGVESNKYISKKYIDRENHTYTRGEKEILNRVLSYYHIVISKHSDSEKITITSGIKKALLTALSEFTPVQLLMAIDGFSGDEWQMSENSHRGAEWFFKKESRVSQYLGLYNKNKKNNFTKTAINYLNK